MKAVPILGAARRIWVWGVLAGLGVTIGLAASAAGWRYGWSSWPPGGWSASAGNEAAKPSLRPIITGDCDHDHDHAAHEPKAAALLASDSQKAEGQLRTGAPAPRSDAGTLRSTDTGHRHDEADALKLGVQTQKSIGVQVSRVELKTFQRATTVPGMVVERPGQSTLDVTAPTTGVVTHIFPIQGQAVEPEEPLFEIRLTHEDLLQKQTEFLQSLEELDVLRREVARLEQVAEGGAIAGKTLLERKYDQQKQEAALRAQRQALLLHGLSSAQVSDIESQRTLLQSFVVKAPSVDMPTGSNGTARTYQVQEVRVSHGSYVPVGTTLCRLADYACLYVEGSAFEQDVPAVNGAAAEGTRVTAVMGSRTGGAAEMIDDLQILYLDDKVDPASRTFRFYVELPNRRLREDVGPQDRRFVYWQFRPGQRVQLRIPVETWPDRIVLPAEAVAQDGMEHYVFEFNEDHFDRRVVHVEYRDADWVVIANDGAIRPGVLVASSAAHQMQLALKNRAGGGVDPHAGHNH